ncbi:uncharacterized protein LOC123264629 [Cotesia glomerata]|uniref:uncharacterized protein LOC123264629 n=1 Tax=Cotesia glomerata TaxID=32391 RepID=UPI001D007F91|nr:uncharacterized protein LOC123264629 [Cotesia glomerata]
MENYLEWKMIGGNKRMKSNILPHKYIEESKLTSVEVSPMEVDQPSSEKSSFNFDDKMIGRNSSNNIDNMDLEYLDTANSTATQDFKASASNVFYDNFPPQTIKVNAAVQVKIRSLYRSTQIQCKPQTKDRATSSIKIFSGVKNLDDSCSSSISNNQVMNTSNTTVSSFPTSSDNLLSTNPSTENEWTSQYQQEEFQKLNLKQTFQKIQQSPRKYIGIPNDCMDIIDILRTAKLSDVEIFLTLKKIRLNESFAILADDFGMSTSNVSRTFTKTLPIITEYLKDFIIWPSSAKIKQQLPMSFRSRYAAVESIIDCLEIEIEKPTDPVKQSLTWSKYKKCNTVKYLVSCIPDGIVNFISPGYGGRASDAEIVSNSGYLDYLKPGAAVLAGRGFKHIENLVVAKKCTLIRPPTVSSNKQPTHDEVIATKRIASLRIHIERLIRRIREFHICEPHSCVNVKLIPQMDNIITIVAALTNLQGPLIKKT